MIFAVQLFGFILTLGMIYFALVHYRKGELNRTELSSWVFIWSMVLLVIMFPDIARSYARTFLFTRLFDLMMVGGFVVLFIMMSRMYVRINRLEKKLEKYVRQEAINSSKVKSKKSK